MSKHQYIPYLRVIILVIASVYISGCATTGSTQDAEQREKQALYNLFQAKQHYNSRNFENAMLHGVKVLSLDPGNTDALKIVAAIHDIQKDYAKAEQTYRTLLAIVPESQFAHEGLGIILLRNGNIEKAKSHLEIARKSNLLSWRAKNALGVLHDLKANYVKAAEYYRDALNISQRPEILNNYGFNQYLLGDYKSAELLFKQILHTNPGNEVAWSNLALTYFKMSKHEEAVNALEHIMPKHQALNNIGYLANLANQPEVARMLLTEATREASGYYTKAYANLSDVPQ